MAKKIRYKTYIGYDYGTVATRDKETGRLTGRKSVRGFGDKTANLRVISPKRYQGQIRGRTEPIAVKGSARARGHTRSML